MTTTPDVEWMAEAVERARFENLRQGVWEDLRPGERTTRVGILRDAIVRSGVGGEIDSLRTQADRTALLLDLIDQRDRETAQNRSRHESEVARLAHEVSALRAKVAHLSGSLAEAEARASYAETALQGAR